MANAVSKCRKDSRWNNCSDNNTDLKRYVIVTVEGKLDLCNAKVRDFYRILINIRSEQPTAIAKWNNTYDDINWSSVFTLPFRLLRDTKIQTLQYKILTRIFPCNQQLFKWKIIQSPRCSDCYEIDTIEHYFCECEIIQAFWDSFMKWWNHVSGCYFHLNNSDIIFGIEMEDGNIIKALNYCILIVKRYIYVEKYNKRELFFLAYLQDLKYRLGIEIYLEKGKAQKNIDYLDTIMNIYEQL